MFPTYSKIVEVVFSQIIANNMFEKLDNAAELRIHAQVTHVLNTLLPDLNLKLRNSKRFNGLLYGRVVIL
ncbi:hypothetical protein T73t3_212 [Escherichia phage T4]|nr:hypothetical protein T73t3_212 [Escherichia phage T4]